jgi:hypothetical protein
MCVGPAHRLDGPERRQRIRRQGDGRRRLAPARDERGERAEHGKHDRSARGAHVATYQPLPLLAGAAAGGGVAWVVVVDDPEGDVPGLAALFSGQPVRAAAAANANRTERALRGVIMAKRSHASRAEGRGAAIDRLEAAPLSEYDAPMNTIAKHGSLTLAGLALLAVFALGACDKDNKSSSTQTSSASSQTTAAVTTTPEAKAAPSAAPSAAADGAMGKAAATWKGIGLSTPESVLHDDATDTYLVSNIDGQPAAVDGKGFIAKLSPDGTVATLKWIESGKNKVTLNAPKGMAFMGDNLYVADIDTVRIFDRKTGNPVADVKVPGATFLNDVALGTDGRILVSDTGVKPGAKGFEPTGTDAVYAIDKDKKVAAIAKSKDLGGPNGITVGGDNKVWIAAMNSGEIYSLDMKGKRADVQKMPKGMLDGIFALGSDLVVSSWDASAVYRGKPGGDFKVVVEGAKSPADISYDKKRGRVLVPLFTENEVRAYDLK